ncbi:MAG TPA: bifunctional metallophosphatase/5'-nucleotidase [Burkholderiaceae bacterium]
MIQSFSSPLLRAGLLAASLILPGCASVPPAAIELNLVGLNDFHGHLEAQNYTYTSIAEKAPRTTRAGGVLALSSTLQAWRKLDPELILIGSGDLVGASPPLSAMWADEPSLMALDLLGLRVSSVGNHEFDWGKAELLRQQRGGCASPRPDKACKLDGQFAGARFSYLAANVTDTETGQLLLPAYRIEQAHGVKVAFIGAVLRETPSVVKASGVRGLAFGDEAEAINRVLPELRAQGATVFVVLIHQGGYTSSHFDDPSCRNLAGPIVDITRKLDPAIKLVVSGHSHKGYLCKVGETTVTQAQNQGLLLSRIALRVDPATKAVLDVQAKNVVMHAEQSGGPAPAADVAALLARVKDRSAALLNRPVARLAVPAVLRKQNAAGESALGDLITDAQLEAGKPYGAQIAFLNSSTMRAELLSGPGNVSTHGQSAVVLPFGNDLMVMTLSGAQLEALLNQQRFPSEAQPDGKMLDISSGFTYEWDAKRPAGARVVPGSLRLHGKAVEPNADYRIVANSFIAEGGDDYSVFKQGRDRLDKGISDIGAVTGYLIARDKAGQPAGAAEPAARIRRLN